MRLKSAQIAAQVPDPMLAVCVRVINADATVIAFRAVVANIKPLDHRLRKPPLGLRTNDCRSSSDREELRAGACRGGS